jgi:hypothetical protein
MRVGLLIDFHVRVLKNGLKRIVDDFPDSAGRAAKSAKDDKQGIETDSLSRPQRNA